MKRTGLFFILAALAAGQAQAYDAVLKNIKGEVLVRPQNSNRFKAVKKGHKLQSNDQVRVGPTGGAQVVFKSGSTVLVKERSRFLVKADQRGEFISFSRGEFLIGLRKKLTGGQQFRVRTPACVAAVRGTVFWGLSDDDKSSTYACFKGAIDVTAQGKTVNLTPGQQVQVKFEAAPGDSVAANIPGEYVNTFAIDQDLGGVDEILKDGGAK